jgi:hypothetical protein
LLTLNEQADFANDIFYILVLYLSKCSLGLLYLRLTPAKGHTLAAWSIIAGSTVWAVMSVMLISIRCHVGNPWASWGTECTNFVSCLPYLSLVVLRCMQFPRWEVIGTLDIVLEFALFLMAVYLVKGLQMSLRAKAIVVAAFGSRLLVIPAAALRLYYLNPDVLPAHRNVAISYVFICAQLELGYGLMASTIPCLKPFIAVYEGPKHPCSTYNRSYGKESTGDYNPKSFNSAQLKSNSSADAPTGRKGNGPQGFRPDQIKYMATATVTQSKGGVRTHISHGHSPGKGHGIGHGGRNERSSDDSRQMIIETKTDWSVEYDTPSARGMDGGSDESRV